MGPDLELKSKSENVHAPAFSGQKVLEAGTNYMGDANGMETLPIEQTPLSNGNEDVEVNITGCTNSGKSLVEEDSCDDVTEGSSSFGGTGSGTENASSFSDTEVESRMCAGNASSSMCDDWCEPLQRRKKRMTIHWRRFIRPLMWRCKWIELQLKQLQSQALKYDKELAAYNYTKQVDFAHLTLDGSDIKSVPITGRMHRNKVMKRIKRKRVEEKWDLASYTSNHSLFSYYEKTDHAVDACLNDFHGVAIGGNNDNNEEFELNDVWSSVEYENNDKSLDDFIQKIEAVLSQVHKLKTRIDKVVSENPGKFCSVTQLSTLGPSDGFNHADLNSPFTGNENTFPVSFVHSSSRLHSSSQLQSEFHMGDPLMPGNTSSSREGITPLIGTSDRHVFEDPWEDTKDGVLIQNQAAKEELHDFENVRNHLVEKTKGSVEESEYISQVQVSEADLATENAVHNLHSTLKLCSTLKSNVTRNKRKGRKKSGSKRWSRKSSG